MGLIACIAGATGVTGLVLTELALADPRYSAVKVLVRKPGGMPAALRNPKLIEVVTDYEALTIQGAWPAGEVNHMFICLGTTMRKARNKTNFKRVDYEYVVCAANAARDAGAEHCAVISSFGVGGESKAFYIKVKTMMESAMQIIGFPSLHIIRPSLIDGDRTESRPLEAIGLFFTKLAQPLLIGPWAKYRVVPARALATAMLVGAHEDMQKKLRITESHQISTLQA
jgi:uncharacterized protein YbjT (DUF2867 family)